MGLYVFTEKIKNLIDSMAVAQRLSKNTKNTLTIPTAWKIREYSREADGRDIIKIDNDIQIDIYAEHLHLHLPMGYGIQGIEGEYIQLKLRRFELENQIESCEFIDFWNRYLVTMKYYDEDLMIETLSKIFMIYM